MRLLRGSNRRCRHATALALVLAASGVLAQAPAAPPAFDAFDVATIKLVDPGAGAGRYIVMQGPHRFVAKAYSLQLLIAAAYNLNPRTVSGGPAWVESDRYDILAVSPGDSAIPPTRDQQMSMLRSLLADRFKLTFHREQKDFSLYELRVAKNGPNPNLKPSTAPAYTPAALISTVFPQRILLPARNATMGEFASVLQRAVLDRPVVDKTGLSGRYDFDLEWAPDESQFGGEVKAASDDAPSAPFFQAVEQQLGLRLQATRGPVEALVVDGVTRPSAN